MKKEVYTNVLFAKEGNSEVLMELIKQFKPLLKKYAWNLGYEDSYEDLQLEFIKLIKEFPTENLSLKNDAGVVSYIKKSIYHSFIALSKKEHNHQYDIPFSDLEDEDNPNKIDGILAGEDIYYFADLEFLHKILTGTEYDIIIECFYFKRSIKEIAEKRKLSSAAISKSKRKALEKLRQAYVKEV